MDGVTFSVAPGQFFGFLGPNGAGKSTTIKMLTGLLEPTSGTIEILGQPFSATALLPEQSSSLFLLSRLAGSCAQHRFMMLQGL